MLLQARCATRLLFDSTAACTRWCKLVLSALQTYLLGLTAADSTCRSEALKLTSTPTNQIPISVACNGDITVKWQGKEGMSESLSSSWPVGWVPVQKRQQQSHSSLVRQALVCWITILDYFPDGFICAAGGQGR